MHHQFDLAHAVLGGVDACKGAQVFLFFFLNHLRKEWIPCSLWRRPRRAAKKTKGQSAFCFPTFFINKKVGHKRKQGKKNIMLKRTLRERMRAELFALRTHLKTVCSVVAPSDLLDQSRWKTSWSSGTVRKRGATVYKFISYKIY